MAELLLKAKFPQALKTLCEKINKYPLIFYDDDDDEESSIPLRDIISKLPLLVAIVTEFLIMDSLIIEGEHLDAISKTKSDKVIKSSVENRVPILSESKDLTDYKSKCDMPICDDSSSKNGGLDDIVSILSGKEIDHLDAIPDSVQSLLNQLNSEIPDAIIESFSPSPIPVEDCDSLMKEIDIFLALDGSIPPGIENDDYDSKRDVLFLKNYLTIILFPFLKVVDDISNNSTRELYVHVPNVLPTLPTLYPVFDTLLPFSFKNEDKVFNPRILASKEKKSPHLLSHRGFKAFKHISDFFESPMMIYGANIPILEVLFLHFYPP
uniref:Reverse transcriptase domain-containing protein n=1 Tax=Tanacetum cinerariifolium TaxID=118510 RepID=A0A6L2N2X2_TANCI|nr:hypothetical protein [Tanacetum cinerariifolium]